LHSIYMYVDLISTMLIYIAHEITNK
jgi:hypothetical protein